MRKDTNALAGIYRITCLPNGKVYVGQARKVSQRWTMHRLSLRRGEHRNGPLQDAWNTYGADAFICEIVCRPIGPHDPETMTYLEVEVLKNYPDAFNLMVPIQAYLGAHASTRAKLSAQRLELWSDPEFRGRRVAALRAQKSDPAYKAAHREGMRAFHASEEGKTVRREGGKKASQAWVERTDMREAESKRRKNLWDDPDYRARQLEARKKTWADPEVRAKRLAGMKRAWSEAPPEKREARVQNAAEAQRRDEVRELQRQRTQERWDSGNGPRPRKR